MTVDYRAAAADVVARLTPAERSVLAERAVMCVLAMDGSLNHREHREHVMGILSGAAPTFAREIQGMITNARNACVRKPVR